MLKLTIKRVLFFATYFSPFSFPAPRHHAKPHITSNAPKNKDKLTGSLFNLAPKYKAKTGVIIVISATVLALDLCRMKKQAKIQSVSQIYPEIKSPKLSVLATADKANYHQ